MVQVPFLDLNAQHESIKDQIMDAVHSVIESKNFIKGPFVTEFESSFAKYLGARHCIAVANGTDALFLALKALGIGPGDEVISVPNTFMATSEMITASGAKVVWANINSDTMQLDTESVTSLITPCTKAIIPVHLYGNIVDMEPLADIARDHGLSIINDAAQAHGALYKNQSLVAFGDITTYSFYPGKNLGAYGDAGAVVTNRDDCAIKVRMLSDHGRTEKYIHEFEGYSSRMDAIQAAILKVKLPYLEKWNEKRRAIAREYDAAFSQMENIHPMTVTPSTLPVYHLYVVQVPAPRRDALRKHLLNAGIQTGIHYPVSLPYQPAYRTKALEDRFSSVQQQANSLLSLPIFPEMTDKQLQSVIEAVKSFPLS